MYRSKALTGSGPEPRKVIYGPTLTCPHCEVRREYLRCAPHEDLAPGRARRAPAGWEAVCGCCGEEFVVG